MPTNALRLRDMRQFPLGSRVSTIPDDGIFWIYYGLAIGQSRWIAPLQSGIGYPSPGDEKIIPCGLRRNLTYGIRVEGNCNLSVYINPGIANIPFPTSVLFTVIPLLAGVVNSDQLFLPVWECSLKIDNVSGAICSICGYFVLSPGGS